MYIRLKFNKGGSVKSQIKAGIVFLSFLLISSQFWGCEESTPVDPNSQVVILPTVSGNIVSFWGVPLPGLKVYTDSVTSTTDAQGNFTLTNVIAPYNVYISDSSTNRHFVFKGLNTDKIKYIYELYPSQGFGNTCELQVTASSNGLVGVSKAKFIFSDGEYLNAYGDVGGSSSVRMREYGSVTGTLHLIGYNTDQNGNITSYERYGKKSVTLSAGGTVSVNFDSTEITFNPDEGIVSGTFGNLSGTSIFNTLTLSVGEFYTPNFSTIISFQPSSGTTSFNMVVPLNLPGSIKAHIFSQDYTSITKKIRISLDPGQTGNVYNFESKPELLQPQPGASVNLSTLFTFSQGQQNGIYIVTFSDGVNEYRIFTSDSEFTLESLTPLGINLSSGSSYTWNVEKIGEYSSVDEYCITPAKLSAFFSKSDSQSFTVQ